MIIFNTALKRIIKQPMNIVFILLFPIVCVFLISITGSSETTAADLLDVMLFGVVDLDDTALSRALVNGLEMRYNVREIAEEDIAAALTDASVPWVLLIRDGYGQDVLAGRAPALEGYSLTVSDVSALGSVAAQNITRALILLGTDGTETLSSWEAASMVDINFLPGDSWGEHVFWLGFYGFISLFTAYFIVKTLTDDKIKGMPDRLGALPQRPRSILVQGTLAAFVVTEATAVLLMLVLHLLLGAIPNPMHLFALLSLYNLFSVGLVLAIFSTLRSLASASAVMTMFATLFSMLGGLFWPLELVPEFMRRVAWFSPGYWLAQGFRSIREITFEGFGVSMLFLAGFTVVVILLGGWKKIQPVEE